MTRESVTIVDEEGNTVATGNVELQRGCYLGSVDVDRMPCKIRKIFEEYEEIVNIQILSLLDQIEHRISDIQLSVIFHGDHRIQLRELQIFPKGRTMSFKV